MTLRLKLALATAGITAIVVIAGGAAFLTALDNNVDSALSDGLRQRSAEVVSAVHTSKQLWLPPVGRPGILPPGEDLTQVVDTSGRILLTSAAASRLLLPADRLVAAIHGPTEFIGAVGPGGDSTRVLAVPVQRPSGEHVIAVVGTSVGVTAHAVATAHREVLITGAIAILLSAAAGWLLARASLRPVDSLRRQAEQISERDTATRLPIPSGKDEIASLASTLDAMLARLQRALARERELIADAGHELRTPLTVLSGELELATRPGRSPEEMSAALHVATEETNRMVRLANELLLLAQFDSDLPGLHFAVTDLPLLITEAARAHRARTEAKGVALRLNLHDLPPVVVDRDRLRQIVDNLLDNSLRFAPPNSCIDISLSSTGDYAILEVADEGPGFPDEFLPHAFDRFRRADSARRRDPSAEGTGSGSGGGLGLAIVRSLARAHRGDAHVENRPEGGAVVRVTFPLTHATPEGANSVSARYM